MRRIFTSRTAKMSAAAAIAALGVVATTATAEAGTYCAQWRYGQCIDWRYTTYNNNDPSAALNMFSNLIGAAVGASQPRYYYQPAPTYYYPPPPAYYAPAPAYGYYGPEYGYYR